jgi:hypothetical protein
MAHGAKADRSSAAGSRITSLLKIDPRAIFQTMGNSRSAEKPCTYFGVTAASSITAPAALVPALVACATTSSTEVAATLAMAATSSSSASNPLIALPARFAQTSPTIARDAGLQAAGGAETGRRGRPCRPVATGPGGDRSSNDGSARC